jgi:hypothetical protein
MFYRLHFVGPAEVPASSTIAAMVSSAFDCELDQRDIPPALTPEKLLALITDALVRKQTKGEYGQNDIPVSVKSDTYPLAYGQEGIWLLQEASYRAPSFMISKLWRIKGRLDIVKVRRCIDILSARHSVLRTRIFTDGGKVLQSIEPTSISLRDRIFHYLDLSGSKAVDLDKGSAAASQALIANSAPSEFGGLFRTARR